MKKFLTLMSLVVIIALLITPNYAAAQQPQSCVKFPEPPKLVLVSPGIYKVVIDNYVNPTSGVKTFHVEVKNWQTGTICFDECVHVQANITTSYTSIDIVCDNPTLTVISWTGNEQQACSGAPCTTFSTLPVVFIGFSATRNNSNVSLTWTTALEVDNRGFSVERLTAGSGWKEVTFVDSKSANGNSSSQLSYNYMDVNNEKGVTQYRIKQIDLNGKSEYSSIAAVRGEGQASKMIIYPNPSHGDVNVLFEDNSSRNVVLINLNGQVVESRSNFTAKDLSFKGLQPGMYMLSVISETGEKVSHKIVIQ